jgi:two-component system cell cycle response regulator
VKPVELVKLNVTIEADLHNLVCFLMESVKRLRGNVFKTALACLNLNQRLRAAGACNGVPFPVSIILKNLHLQVHWENNEFELAQTDSVEPQVIEQLRAYLLNSTEAVDPDILSQRNEAMVRHLHETRTRMERDLAELEVKLHLRQAELQISIHQAETDPLTGLFNRRAFDSRLNQAFRHTMRQKNSPLSLIMLDLDYFKSINDEHGHQYGDRYLINMAKILCSEIREDVDYAFRFGGDEFAMLVYADYATACCKARQILGKMNGKVSIGIATIDQHTLDDLPLEEFIHQADSALYEAKHRGRGRVVVAQCSKLDAQLCRSICDVKAACV